MKAAVVLLLRVGLGGLLLLAGALKLRAPHAFAVEIADYHLFTSLAPFLAATLPVVELALGLGLLVFPYPWRRAAALGALGLLGIFTVAVGSAVARHINIDCGCFGAGGDPITLVTLLRDLALVAAVVALLRLDSP